jgi:2'-5' RNA ligase
MPYAVELYLDPAADAAVRRLWADLAADGVSAVMHEGPYRPHVSLAVMGTADLEALNAALASFAAGMSPLALGLSSIGVFPSAEGVVFLGVVVTEALLRVHTTVHALATRTAGELWDYYTPGRWVPHCTVAYRLRSERIPDVVRLCLQLPLPLIARVAAVGVVEFSATDGRELVTYPWGERAAEA